MVSPRPIDLRSHQVPARPIDLRNQGAADERQMAEALEEAELEFERQAFADHITKAAAPRLNRPKSPPVPPVPPLYGSSLLLKYC